MAQETPKADEVRDGQGLLPQSNALAEASPQSLAELFSRDPEGYSQQDRVAIIKNYREQRERWALVEAAGGSKTKAGSGAAKLSDAKALISTKSPTDLGF